MLAGHTRSLPLLVLLAMLPVLSPPALAGNPNALFLADVSPDTPYSTYLPSLTTSGRVLGIATDPQNDLVAYAATEWAGVWKSVDGGKSWQQSSSGLRSGLTQYTAGPVLAVDADSQRLLYLTQVKDGRGVEHGRSCSGQHQCGYFGGLWVSSDAAATWHHVDPPGCSFASFTSAVFSAGVAYVLSDTPGCRLIASGDPGLTTWLNLPDPPFPPGGDHLAGAPSISPTLFGCQGTTAWQTTAPQAPGTWTAAALPFSCTGVAAVPPNDTTPPGAHVPPTASTAVVSTETGDWPDLERRVYVVDFAAGSVRDLGTFSRGVVCCGIANVFVGPHATRNATIGPDQSYEVFATDASYPYRFRSDGTWHRLSFLHIDSWAMAFPRSFDPSHGACTAFATNDGGVYVANPAAWGTLSTCTPSALENTWLLASTGLRLLFSGTMAGIARPTGPSCKGGAGTCPYLYLPSADDDQWVSTTGGTPASSWKPLDDNLGDAGQTLFDPAVPTMGLAVRGPLTLHFQVSSTTDPPDSWAGYQDITPPNGKIGNQDGPQGGITQVLTLPQEAFDHADYFALQSPGNGLADEIVRNDTAGVGSGPGTWQTVISGSAPFGTGVIGALVASGGHQHTTLYVLTTDGSSGDYTHDLTHHPNQVYRGDFTDPTHVPFWQGASGAGFTTLGSAYSLSVDPYDANELYVTDLGPSPGIKVSRDGGASWFTDTTLTDLSTNHGEFDFDCGNFPYMDRYYIDKEILGNQCPLMQVVFTREKPLFRFAVLYPGGVAFSRDRGHHWMFLGVTHEAAAQQPIELPMSAFYDPTPIPSLPSYSALFIALEGRSLKEVMGPFDTLETGRVTFCARCRRSLANLPGSAQLSAVILSPGAQVVPLRNLGGGLYQGEFLFDSATTQLVRYQIQADGVTLPGVFVQPLDGTAAATGVLPLTDLPPASLAAQVVATGVGASGAPWVDVALTNSGTVPIVGARLDRIGAEGGVSITGPSAPLPLPALDPGASTTIRVELATGRVNGSFRLDGTVAVQDLAGRDSVASFGVTVRLP